MLFVGSGESHDGGKRRVRRDTRGVRGERGIDRGGGRRKAAVGGRQGEGLDGPRSEARSARKGKGRKKGGLGKGRKRRGKDNGVSES